MQNTDCNKISLNKSNIKETDKYIIIKNIGNGSYGSVYLCKEVKTEELYAIKKINFNIISKKDKESIENEVKLLENVCHPNIVSYKESYLDNDNFFNIVMEYCEGGDAYSEIRKHKSNFSENLIIDYIIQICLSLNYIHDLQVLHRDLKTENLFFKDRKIKIGDFGIAKSYYDTKNAFTQTMVGTPLYMAPELYSGKKHTFKSDIWSLGCCIYEFCNKKNTFEGSSWNGVALKVMKGNYQHINSFYSQELRDLINQMLSISPNKRPTISNILGRKLIKVRLIKYISEYLNTHKKDYIERELSLKLSEVLINQSKKLGIIDLIECENIKNNNNSNNTNNEKFNNEISKTNVDNNAKEISSINKNTTYSNNFDNNTRDKEFNDIKDSLFNISKSKFISSFENKVKSLKDKLISSLGNETFNKVNNILFDKTNNNKELELKELLDNNYAYIIYFQKINAFNNIIANTK